jgi:hypothetical protein
VAASAVAGHIVEYRAGVQETVGAD